MSTVRDPAFWKRFSVAVHQDEEEPAELKHTYVHHALASTSTRLTFSKRSDSWLARQHAKRTRRTCICCAFWLSFAGVVAVVPFSLAR